MDKRDFVEKRITGIKEREKATEKRVNGKVNRERQKSNEKLKHKT